MNIQNFEGVKMTTATIPNITPDAQGRGDASASLLSATFPLKAGTKRPAIDGWQHTVAGQYQPPSTSYGINLPADVLVLDADPRNYGDRPDVLSELLAACPELLPTRTVKTPSDGFHVYTTKPAEVKIKKHQAAWPGIDFLSRGCYVVGQGTVTDAGTYVVIDDAPIKPIPEEFLATLEQSGEASENEAEVTLSYAPQFRAQCMTADFATKGSRGSSAYRIACDGRDLGLPENVVLEYLAEFWAIRCSPPLHLDGPNGLRDSVSNAYKYAKNGFGSTTPEAVFTSDMAAPPAMLPLTAGANSRQGPPGGESFPRTDIGNAARFVACYRDNVRWHSATKKWLVWDGRRWKPDATEHPVALAIDMVKQMCAQASDQESMKFAASISSDSKIKAMLNLAKPNLAITSERLDTDHNLFNCLNGTIDLRSGELRPHRPDDYITKLAPVEYHPDSFRHASRFQIFLREIFNGSDPLIEYLQTALGYSLSGSTQEHKLFIAHGGGANGKSTLFNAVQEVIGDYAQVTDPVLLITPPRSTSSPDVARLRGVRFAITQELEEGVSLNESRVKYLTGGDRLVGRALYKDHEEFDSTHKIWIVTNPLPQVKSQCHAIWRRITLIPFEAKFTEDTKDVNLPQKLRLEYQGIFAWLIQGCVNWHKHGLHKPAEVAHATEKYKGDEDALSRFIAERCYLHPNARVQATPLREEYLKWCKDNFESELNKNQFPARLRERPGISSEENRQGKFWCGLGLQKDFEQITVALEGLI